MMMIKFMQRTLVAFALIFISLFCITMLLEYNNKEAINTEVNVEVNIKDGNIEIPETPPKVAANYKFTQIYFYTSLVISLVTPLLFYFYGGVNIIKKRNFKYKIVQGTLLYLLYFIFSEILIFPKILFSAFYRARLVGLSSESFLSFFSGLLTSNLINFIITLPVIVAIYIIFIKRKRWYVSAAAILVMVTIVSSYLYPYLDELENNLKPMEDGSLKNKILELSEEAGIDNLDIRVIEKSNETNGMNAYMTGINNSRRIVFWDTTLNKLSDKEILSIAAHEMGHYKLGHIKQSIIIGCFGICVICFCVHMIMKKYKGTEYRKIDNLPQLLFLLNLITLIALPIENAYSRKIEIDADKFAMELTNDGQTNGVLEIRFIKSNLSPIDVDPLFKWLALDHPTTKTRIELSNDFVEK